MIFLKLSVEGKALNDYALDQPVVTIGTDADNVVLLNGKGIRPHHARITFDSLLLEDQSGEGVSVNGSSIKSATLENGDTIGIGEFEITFFHSKSLEDGSDSQTKTWKVTREVEEAASDEPTWKYVKTIKV